MVWSRYDHSSVRGQETREVKVRVRREQDARRGLRGWHIENETVAIYLGQTKNAWKVSVGPPNGPHLSSAYNV